MHKGYELEESTCNFSSGYLWMLIHECFYFVSCPFIYLKILYLDHAASIIINYKIYSYGQYSQLWLAPLLNY